MSIYKGTQLLDASTDEMEAVALGNKKLFQSYIVCSEHGERNSSGTTVVSTVLTYGKIRSGNDFENIT